MQMSTDRRHALRSLGAGLAVGAAALGAGEARAATGEPSLVPRGATSLAELTARLAKAPRRRDFKSVPMILTKPEEWDHAALDAVLGYHAGPKQAWDNTNLAGPWLNLMRNTMNAQVYAFRHPDFLCVSATHGPAHLALFDDAMWEKYQFAKLTGGKFTTNTLVETPQGLSTDFEANDGIYSGRGDTITLLQRRGAVFLACHNAIWELSERLIKAGTNPDHLALEALAAELTNHLIPGIVVTPGIVATLVELQRHGFAYAV
jgi:hypothetical protein